MTFPVGIFRNVFNNIFGIMPFTDKFIVFLLEDFYTVAYWQGSFIFIKKPYINRY